MQSPFVHKPTLTGQAVVLRPYLDADLPYLADALADPDVLRLTGSANSSKTTNGRSAEPDDKMREWYSTRNEQADRLDLMIIDKATGHCVGEVVLNQWDVDNETCNFRILVGPAGQNRGLGTEATTLLMDYAFTHLPLNRIELEVYAFNPRAQRVYEKAGFVAEGRRRAALKFDGEFVDAIVMSILKSDTPLPR